jgi:hypothetical protein
MIWIHNTCLTAQWKQVICKSYCSFSVLPLDIFSKCKETEARDFRPPLFIESTYLAPLIHNQNFFSNLVSNSWSSLNWSFTPYCIMKRRVKSLCWIFQRGIISLLPKELSSRCIVKRLDLTPAKWSSSKFWLSNVSRSDSQVILLQNAVRRQMGNSG